MYYLVRAYRAVLIYATSPDPVDLAIVTCYGAAVFMAGGLFFRHMKRGFADVL
jgi:lipopolysaccharide transport system permease protein